MSDIAERLGVRLPDKEDESEEARRMTKEEEEEEKEEGGGGGGRFSVPAGCRQRTLQSKCSILLWLYFHVPLARASLLSSN
eukprot:5755324-Pyramimonas_sp.AAC.1